MKYLTRAGSRALSTPILLIIVPPSSLNSGQKQSKSGPPRWKPKKGKMTTYFLAPDDGPSNSTGNFWKDWKVHRSNSYIVLCPMLIFLARIFFRHDLQVLSKHKVVFKYIYICFINIQWHQQKEVRQIPECSKDMFVSDGVNRLCRMRTKVGVDTCKVLHPKRKQTSCHLDPTVRFRPVSSVQVESATWNFRIRRGEKGDTVSNT